MDAQYTWKYPDITQAIRDCIDWDSLHTIGSHTYVWADKYKLDEFDSLMRLIGLKQIDNYWYAVADNRQTYCLAGAGGDSRFERYDVGVGGRIRPDLLNNYIKRVIINDRHNQ